MRTDSGRSVPRSFLQRRLVVEQIELRGRAVLEEVDDPLGLGREVRQSGQAAAGVRILGQQRRQRGHADAGARCG